MITSTPPWDIIDSNNIAYILQLIYANKEITSTYSIAVKQKLFVQCQNLSLALFTFLWVVHYIFNLSYHPKSQYLLYFFQEKFMEIPLQLTSVWLVHYWNVMFRNFFQKRCIVDNFLITIPDLVSFFDLLYWVKAFHTFRFKVICYWNLVINIDSGVSISFNKNNFVKLY